MGRIDEALRRANFDAGVGTGASLAQAPSPWVFDEPNAREDRGSSTIAVCRPGESAAADDFRAGARGHPLRSGDFDEGIVERLVAWRAASPLLIEQFRSLAATLLQAQVEQGLKSIVVTSAAPGDGKSHVAVNLALTLADSFHRRVVLIDADLRRPVLSQIFRLPSTRGLGEALKARTDEEPASFELSPNLTLIPAGLPEQNPLSGLSSDRMKRIVEHAASRFEWVVLDSPPVGILADGRLVSEIVDAVILVVRAGVTRFSDLEAAAASVGRDRILGVVLNAVDPAEIRGQSYYHDYYGNGSSLA